ncbi:MAG: alkaline phosphatase family protein [Terriglobia bacterium]
MNARRLGRCFTIALALGLASLLPQIAWCAGANIGSQLRTSKQVIQAAQGEVPAASQDIKHVLLLIIDGAHPFDVENYIETHPQSALAKLKAMGVWYKNASTTIPSDSFPSMMAMITGGGPATTGVWYEVSYHRDLSPPGSDCSTTGTEVYLDETIDINKHDTWGGGGFNTAELPRDPKNNCAPVYPHQLLRVNTIFDVIKQAGMETAFSDKQRGDEIEQGPTGHAIDEPYTPENASLAHTYQAVEQYDDFRNQALLNWINGKNSKGTGPAPVPAIMGITFQSPAQAETNPKGGWTDASGTPSALLTKEFNHVDADIGKLLDELKANGLMSSTVIIVTAKHGDQPIDVTQVRRIDPKIMIDAVDAVAPHAGHGPGDDIDMFWLQDPSKTAAAVKALEAVKTQAHIRRIISGAALKSMYDDPRKDPETPDIIVEPELGVIYMNPKGAKIGEHGGFSIEDTHVPILVSNPRFEPGVVHTPVSVAQIAPTILKLLSLDPQALEAVRIDKTAVLPGLF